MSTDTAYALPTAFSPPISSSRREPQPRPPFSNNSHSETKPRPSFSHDSILKVLVGVKVLILTVDGGEYCGVLRKFDRYTLIVSNGVRENGGDKNSIVFKSSIVSVSEA